MIWINSLCGAPEGEDFADETQRHHRNPASGGVGASAGGGLALLAVAGEGDRATLGCSYGATATAFTCLAVRCEDDFSVGVHIHTSRTGGDAGRWVLEFDREAARYPVTATGDGSPYRARIDGDVAPILEQLKTAGLVYLDPEAGPPIERAISLSGSLVAINQALYFCAAKVPSEAPADQPAM